MTCIHIQVGTLNTRASPHVSRNFLGSSFENAGYSVVTPYSIRVCAEKDLCVPRFLANLLVFYIVDGVKGDLIFCFNIITLLCKDHVNIHVALN